MKTAIDWARDYLQDSNYVAEVSGLRMSPKSIEKYIRRDVGEKLLAQEGRVDGAFANRIAKLVVKGLFSPIGTLEEARVTNKKALKEEFTMFRPDSREQALSWIESEADDLRTQLEYIQDYTNDEDIYNMVDKAYEKIKNILMLSREGQKLDEHRINPKATPVGPGKGIDYMFQKWATGKGLAISKEGDYSKAIGHVGADTELKIVLRSTQSGDAVYLDVYSDGEQIDQFKSDTIEEYKNDLVEIARCFADYGKGITPIRESKKLKESEISPAEKSVLIQAIDFTKGYVTGKLSIGDELQETLSQHLQGCMFEDEAEEAAAENLVNSVEPDEVLRRARIVDPAGVAELEAELK